MNRRELMLLLASATAAAQAVRAQQKAVPVIGYLGGTTPGTNASFVAAFLQGPERNRTCRGAKRGDRIPLGGEPV
jgi:hypothetical protein